MKRKPTIGALTKKAQALANRYARLRDCPEGWGYCISCGERKDFDQVDGGHFIPSTRSALRFDERNINAQCTRCNRFLHANQANYLVGLEKKLGREVVDELLVKQHEHKSWTRSELEAVISYYQTKLKLLQA